MSVEFDETDDIGQAFLKCFFYGGPKAGKTETALKVAVQLGKTLAIDTERGTDPYRKKVRHPDGTPFGVVRTRSAKEIYTDVLPQAEEKEYKCIIVDQVTTIWDDCKDVYIYREMQKQSKAWDYIERNGRPPFQGWSFIKGPYKRMLRELLNYPGHVFILSRLSDVFKVSGEGEPKKIDERADTEKNAQYEPAVLVKMEYNKIKKKHFALVEGDRWGQLQGAMFENPGPDFLDPIIKVLGDHHGRVPAPEENELSTSEIPEPKRENPNPGQERIIRSLAKKGGIEDEVINLFLEQVSSIEAARAINQMTIGNFDVIKGE